MHVSFTKRTADIAFPTVQGQLKVTVKVIIDEFMDQVLSKGPFRGFCSHFASQCAHHVSYKYSARRHMQASFNLSRYFCYCSALLNGQICKFYYIKLACDKRGHIRCRKTLW